MLQKLDSFLRERLPWPELPLPPSPDREAAVQDAKRRLRILEATLDVERRGRERDRRDA